MIEYDIPYQTECKHCQAPVIFLLAEKSGKVNILDAAPVESGNVAIINRRAVYARKDAPLPEGADRYVSHFVTCPDADAVRAELASRTRAHEASTRRSWE